MEAVTRLSLPTMVLDDGRRFGLFEVLGLDEEDVDGEEIGRRTKDIRNLAVWRDAELLRGNQRKIPPEWNQFTPLFVGTTKKGPRGYVGFTYLWRCPRFREWHVDDRWIKFFFGRRYLVVCRVFELTFEVKHLVLPSP